MWRAPVLRALLGVRSSLLTAAWLLPVGLVLAAGEPPQLDYLFPAGGQRGSVFLVLAGGRLEPWPVKVWTDDPGLVFRDEDGRGRFQVELSPQAGLGPHLMRIFTSEGASAPRLFMVGQPPEETEGGFGERTDSGERIDRLPVIINGRLRIPGETHTFLLKLDAGFWLRATVDAYKLDSSLRASLLCLDEKGQTVPPTLIEPGLDPNLAWSLTRSGAYRIQLSAATDAPRRAAGYVEGQAAVYRLALTSEQVEASSNAPPVNPDAVSSEILRPFQVAQQVTLPGTVHGHMDPPGKEARYAFEARPGEQFFFRVLAASLGSSLAPVLKVLDEGGHSLAQSRPAPDADLTWVAPAEGAYTLTVTDAQGRGGLDFPYQLELGAPQPCFRGSMSEHTFRLEAGQSLEFAVNVSRPKYYEGLVNLTVIGLPPGVVGTPGPIPPEGGKVMVTLSAAEGANPASQPFQVAIVLPNLAVPQVVLVKAPVTGKYAAPGELLINETDQLWVTVLPPSAPKR